MLNQEKINNTNESQESKTDNNQEDIEAVSQEAISEVEEKTNEVVQEGEELAVKFKDNPEISTVLEETNDAIKQESDSTVDKVKNIDDEWSEADEWNLLKEPERTLKFINSCENRAQEVPADNWLAFTNYVGWIGKALDNGVPIDENKYQEIYKKFSDAGFTDSSFSLENLKKERGLSETNKGVESLKLSDEEVAEVEDNIKSCEDEIEKKPSGYMLSNYNAWISKAMDNGIPFDEDKARATYQKVIDAGEYPDKNFTFDNLPKRKEEYKMRSRIDKDFLSLSLEEFKKLGDEYNKLETDLSGHPSYFMTNKSAEYAIAKKGTVSEKELSDLTSHFDKK